MGSHACPPISPVSYKKQSTKTAERNRLRASAYQSSRTHSIQQGPELLSGSGSDGDMPHRSKANIEQGMSSSPHEIRSKTLSSDISDCETAMGTCDHDTSDTSLMSISTVCQNNQPDVPDLSHDSHKFWDPVVESTQTCHAEIMDNSSQTESVEMPIIRKVESLDKSFQVSTNEVSQSVVQSIIQVEDKRYPCSYCELTPDFIYKCDKSGCFCGLSYCLPCKELWSHCQHNENWVCYPN